MKELVDWNTTKVVNIFDELTLWSAPFGQMMLEHMPMTKGISIVDIGFGTGFPLIELSQRFGAESRIYGVDIWKEGIARAKEKIAILEIDNIKILESSATSIAIEDNSIDLITSNLGINNFENKEEVYSEIHRLLKKDGRLCITTNPVGTFKELFKIILNICEEKGFEEANELFEQYVNSRSTKQQIVEEFANSGFELVTFKEDATNMRFVDAQALFDHSLIRIGFRAYWEKMIEESNRAILFEAVMERIEQIIAKEGAFKITIPMLYLEFTKQ